MHQQSAQTSNDAIRGAKVRRPLSTAIEHEDLMSHQNRFSNDGTEPTGSAQPDDDDDGVQKKAENVSHAQDRIKRKKLNNSGLFVEFATNRFESRESEVE
jgi:hypothetical protein